MALTLIKETGAGLANANSYASVADGVAYHEGHLYATAWDNAGAAAQAVALVMATRLIDACYQFGGLRAIATQALQWPREDCPNPDSADAFPSDEIPATLIEATCELARELIVKDLTAAPEGEGLSYLNVGTTQKGFNKSDTPQVITRVVQAMLGKLGSMTSAKSGSVKLVRV